MSEKNATNHLNSYVDGKKLVLERVFPVKDHVEGDLRGGVMDPFGHIWWIATHIKVPLEEIQS